VPKGFQHLKMTVADVHTQDITPYFNPSYDYIEEARLANQGQRPLLIFASLHLVQLGDCQTPAGHHLHSAMLVVVQKLTEASLCKYCCAMHLQYSSVLESSLRLTSSSFDLE